MTVDSTAGLERDLPADEVLECVCSALLGGVLEDGWGSGCLTAMAEEREQGGVIV